MKSGKSNVRALCQSAMTAALYLLLTQLSAALGLSSMVPQCRLSEALCILPLFYPSTVAGLFVGCLLANLLTGCILPDVIFGSLATLLGALGVMLIGRLQKKPHRLPAIAFATLPNILANTLAVPLIQRYAYHLENAYLLLALQVFVGEVISSGILGVVLACALRRIRSRLPRD